MSLGLGQRPVGSSQPFRFPLFHVTSKMFADLAWEAVNLGVAVCQALSQMALLVQENPLATAWSISSDEFLSACLSGVLGVAQEFQQICLPTVWLWSLNKLGRHPEPSFCSPVPLALDLVPFPTQTLSPTSRLLNVLLPPPRRPCPFSKLAVSLQVSDPWFTDSPQGPSHVPYAVPGAGNPA